MNGLVSSKHMGSTCLLGLSDSGLILDWTREAIRMLLVLGGPLLLSALVVGLVVGLIQTMMQMQEPVVGAVARIAAVALTTLALLPWLVRTWIDYLGETVRSIPNWI